MINEENELKNIRKMFRQKYNVYIDYVKNLSESIKDSLNAYTGDHYEDFNRRMRKGIELTEFQENILDNIDLAFKNSIALKEPLYVYKGIDKLLTNFSDKSYISTSFTYTSAKKFSMSECCILKILLPVGTKILPLINISRYSDEDTEDEILLDRDGKITSTSQYINEDDGMMILDCVYIPKDSIQIEDVKEKEEEKEEVIISDEKNIERLIEILKDDYEAFGSISEDDIRIAGESLNIELTKNMIDFVINYFENQ